MIRIAITAEAFDAIAPIERVGPRAAPALGLDGQRAAELERRGLGKLSHKAVARVRVRLGIAS